MDLTGKTAVVTGAGNGLGLEYARTLASLGATVVVNDLGGSTRGEGTDASAAQAAVDQITADGGKAVANTADVTDEEQVKGLIDQAFGITGHLDILICNAGILRDRMSFTMPVEDWDLVTKVHLRGHFLPLHHAARRWRENAKASGQAKPAGVVLTTSRAGLYHSPGQVNYAAAKAGIASMAVIVAREVSRYGVRVNAIAPIAATRLTEAAFGDVQTTTWVPGNVAPMVTFLASDQAAGITGQVFIVGGGKVEWLKTWEPRGEITAKDGVFTLDEVIARQGELFGDASTEPADFPTSTWT